MKTIQQAAKQILQKYLKKDIEHTEPDDFVYVKTALQAMEDAFHDAQRWIPVSEELPEENTEVLVKCLNGKRIQHDVDFAMNGKFHQRTNVTHWRPIELNS